MTTTAIPTEAEYRAVIARDNARLNVFLDLAPEEPRGSFQPALGNGLLDGFCIAVKANIAVKGLPFSAGIGAFRDRIANQDAEVVRRLREAGATILGTVNMEEAALGAVTDNPHFGRTENPRRAGFTAGGSSGGSAAAVAAGMARAALGTDTMGSCRIPAAYCGVVGFKPSYGRFSVRGVEPLSRRLDHVGVIAHNVADVQSIAAVLSGFDADCADSRQFPALDATLPVTKKTQATLTVLAPNSRRIMTTPVRAAYEGAIARLADGGFGVVERDVDFDALAAARRAGLLVCEAELANTLAGALNDNTHDRQGVSQFLRKMIDFGAAKSSSHLTAAIARLDDTQLVLRQQLCGTDALFWPTAPQQAFSFATAIPQNQADATCLANFLGVPAISLPIAVALDELPVGGQLIAGYGADAELLALAALLEPLLLDRR